MSSGKGKIFAKKVLALNELFLRNESLYCKNCFDSNGKKADFLSRAQFRLLMTIQILGKANVTQLGKIFMMSKSSLSITINRLVKESYLQKENDVKDGRVVHFSVTEKGTAIMNKTMDEITRRIEGFYDDINEKDQAILEQGIDCFYKILKSQVEEDKNEK